MAVSMDLISDFIRKTLCFRPLLHHCLWPHVPSSLAFSRWLRSKTRTKSVNPRIT